MEMSIEDKLYAEKLGWDALQYLKDHEERLHSLRQSLDSDAMRILNKILYILDDTFLDDEDCFERIEAIVKVFHESDISTTRHDWG